jgi:predicted short-subunit dehydrogenase-like oxidoreductase (DUF2520 family)
MHGDAWVWMDRVWRSRGGHVEVTGRSRAHRLADGGVLSRADVVAEEELALVDVACVPDNNNIIT